MRRAIFLASVERDLVDIFTHIVAKGRRYWVYAYLFAKKDRANIDEDELKAFRKLADLYGAKTDVEIEKELNAKELVEICNDREA